MNEERRRAIVAEILADSEADELQPYQFTVYDYMQQAGRSREICRVRLMKLVKAGRLRTASVVHNGQRISAYWRPEDEPKASPQG